MDLNTLLTYARMVKKRWTFHPSTSMDVLSWLFDLRPSIRPWRWDYLAFLLFIFCALIDRTPMILSMSYPLGPCILSLLSSLYGYYGWKNELTSYLHFSLLFWHWTDLLIFCLHLFGNLEIKKKVYKYIYLNILSLRFLVHRFGQALCVFVYDIMV